MHPGLDVPELRFAEVCHRPPYARVDQSKDLLARMRISALRDIEISYPRVERSINLAIV